MQCFVQASGESPVFANVPFAAERGSDAVKSHQRKATVAERNPAVETIHLMQTNRLDSESQAMTP